MKAYYDDNFRNKFGDDGAKNAVRRILAHTQHMWKWESITTKLIFNVNSEIDYLKGDWEVGRNLYDFQYNFVIDEKGIMYKLIKYF